MPQIRLTNLKTGINPTPKSLWNLNALTPTQKLTLVYSRIWGSHIGDNYKSGAKYFKKSLWPLRPQLYEQSDPRSYFPWVEQWESFYDRKTNFNKRRMRILMRGVKIGQKQSMNIKKMSIFDTKKTTPTKV